MSDKQTPGLDKYESLPAKDEEPGDQNGSSPKSYYYDDATGYEIYSEEIDDEDESNQG